MKYSLKNAIEEQLKYCESIRCDILKYKGSEEVQRHAGDYAEIISPVIGGTAADWIRIHWGGIYIFININYENNYTVYTLDAMAEYNLNFDGRYGCELITAYSEKEFMDILNKKSEEEIRRAYGVEWDDTEEIYKEAVPQKYIPYVPEKSHSDKLRVNTC